jgi:hypothetical protein
VQEKISLVLWLLQVPSPVNQQQNLEENATSYANLPVASKVIFSQRA